MEYINNDNEIVFLNSKNIISALDGAVEYNGVPSHELFRDKVTQLSQDNQDTLAYAREIELSASTISAGVDFVSADVTAFKGKVERDFVHISGDNVTGSLSAQKFSVLTADHGPGPEGKLYFTGLNVDEHGIGLSVHGDRNNSRLIKIYATNGLSDVTVNDTSLCTSIETYADSRVNDLSGKLTADFTNLATTLSTEINRKIAVTYKVKGSVSSYSQLELMQENWLKAGESECSAHIGEVYNNLSSTKEHPEISGQNFVWVKQAFGESVQETWGWDNIGGIVDFGNFYNRQQTDAMSAELSNLLTAYEWRTIYQDLDPRVTRVSGDLQSVTGQVGAIQGYVDELSCRDVDNPGIILQLSNQITSCVENNVTNLKYLGHITDVAALSSKSLTAFFKEIMCPSGRVKNGAWYSVDFPPGCDSAISTAGDEHPMVVGNGDIVIIHDHSKNAEIPAEDLLMHVYGDSETGNVYVQKAGVSRYDYVGLSGDYSRLVRRVRDTVNSGYSMISAVTYKTDFEGCVSCVVQIKNMLSDLVEDLNTLK